ncbi:hypothetical protein L248_1163 [Schleiferilactobacillus shenzhenensis LY-73]|uniref:Uncharacterized protein n=1 Tax=Schleiferilactobacillus shenzhenensis LY-73 TaxID=1231336 RepID=U4TMG3_9LACO|nr:hypothetical protein L248_1163 [Schleiferilactobacillus shenzhenensis LY-73]
MWVEKEALALKTLIGKRWWAILLYVVWRLFDALTATLPILREAGRQHLSVAAYGRQIATPNAVLLLGPVVSLTLFIILPLAGNLRTLVATQPAPAVHRIQSGFNAIVAVGSSLLIMGTAGMVTDPLTGTIRPGWTRPLDVIWYALAMSLWSWLFLMVGQRLAVNWRTINWRPWAVVVLGLLVLTNLMDRQGRRGPAGRMQIARFLSAAPWLLVLGGAAAVVLWCVWERRHPLVVRTTID